MRRKAYPGHKWHYLPKEGGLGVRDPPIISRASNVKRASKFLDNSNGSLLSDWMQKRYIKNRSLRNITPKHSINSIFWKIIMSAKKDIDLFLKCGLPLRTPGAISESIRVKSHKDSLANGIWSHMPTKISIMWWRIKWNDLNIFQRLRD